MSITLSMYAANCQLDAVADLLDDGFLRVYAGERPSSPDVPVKSQTMLAEMRFGTPAFKPADNGVLRAAQMKNDPSAASSGKPTWYRAFARDGKSAIIDGSVGTQDADMIVNLPEIQKTAKFSVGEFRLRTRGGG